MGHQKFLKNPLNFSDIFYNHFFPDQEEVERRLHAARMKLEKAKSSLDLRNPIKHNPDEESTVRKPTFSSMSKMQNYDEPLTTFASTHELEQRLVQIENVPKLGLPSWRTPMGR